MLSKTRNKIYALGIVGLVFVGVSFVFNGAKEKRELSGISGRSGKIGANSEVMNLQKAAEYYRFEIRQNPEEVKNYVQLAQLYLQQARITGRHHLYIRKAAEMLDEVLKRDPANLEGMLARASMLLTQHRFEEALNLAEEATRRSPYTAMAWGLLSDARKELGDYAGAVEACDRMLAVRPDLRSYSRAAHLREIHGDLDGARRAMKMAVNAGVVGLESHAWTLHQLGNIYLKEGKLDTAQRVYESILDYLPNYPNALSGLAKIHYSKGEHDQAVQRLLQAYEIAPEHGFSEQLVDNYLALARHETANVLIESVFDAFYEHEKQGWNVNLEFASFCAQHSMKIEEAIRRIKEEYRVRPDHIEVLETYAWLLYKTDRLEQAADMMQRALRLNTRDARLYHRAGVIQHRLGNDQRAKTFFEQAFVINPHFVAEEKSFAKGLPASLSGQLSSSR